jgi:hypothetical protein
MGASIYYKENMTLWVSNAAKDWFCEIVVAGAELRKIDISIVFEEEPAIAGCYGISGLGIDMECFFRYFGGKDLFLNHLKFCEKRAIDLCSPEQSSKNLVQLLSWAQYILQGGLISDETDIYKNSPGE